MGLFQILGILLKNKIEVYTDCEMARTSFRWNKQHRLAKNPLSRSTVDCMSDCTGALMVVWGLLL